jgi:hypothetical protein
MLKIRQAIIKHLWWIIAISGMALLVCHSFQIATIKVDTTTLVLLVLILLSPFAAAIKRIKIGEFEAEIDPEEVKRVTAEVARQVPEIRPSGTMEEPPAIGAIRELAKTDHVIALAKLRIELETTLRRLRSRSRVGQSISPHTPLPQIIRDLAADDILPRDMTPSIRDVLAICNRAIHGEAIRAEDAKSVIEAGTELLQAFERLLSEYGVAHPIEKTTITRAEVDACQAAEYRVVSVIPLVDSPQRMTYVLTHEELESYFDGYFEFAEFIISVERTEPNAANIV